MAKNLWSVHLVISDTPIEGEKFYTEQQIAALFDHTDFPAGVKLEKVQRPIKMWKKPERVIKRIR